MTEGLSSQSLGSLASPASRLGAYVLDVVLHGFAIVIIISIAGISVATAAASGSAEGMGLGGLLGFLLVIGYIVCVLMLWARGTTPGKKVLRMRVVRKDGASPGLLIMLIRETIGKFLISPLVFSLGYLWILFDKDHQAWHDKLVSTYVIRDPST